jgi:hypothetical protein
MCISNMSSLNHAVTPDLEVGHRVGQVRIAGLFLVNGLFYLAT